MKTESNISTNVIIAAFTTASCLALDYEPSRHNIPLKSHSFDFVDSNYGNLTKRESHAEGTSTIFWTERDINKSKDFFERQHFELDNKAPIVVEIAQSLFEKSISLDENMTLALSNTLNRVGKDAPELPNRL